MSDLISYFLSQIITYRSTAGHYRVQDDTMSANLCKGVEHNLEKVTRALDQVGGEDPVDFVR